MKHHHTTLQTLQEKLIREIDARGYKPTARLCKLPAMRLVRFANGSANGPLTTVQRLLDLFGLRIHVEQLPAAKPHAKHQAANGRTNDKHGRTRRARP